MEAKDLRIGNLVEVKTSQGIERLEIFGVHETEVITEAQYLTGFIYADLVNCSPIPLTEEWLNRFGFKKTHDVVGYQWSRNGFFISEYSKRPLRLTLRFSQQKAIEYVHQLQNLYFALTGEELTIK